MGPFTPRTPRSRQGAWAARRDIVRKLLRPEEAVDTRPGANGELVCLLGSGERPRTSPLPTSVKLSGVPPKPETVTTVYHWRPIQVREHAQRSEMSYTVGTYVNTLSQPVMPRTFEGATAHVLRLEPNNFRAQGTLWSYLVGGSFVICSGIVLGVCPKEHDPSRGRNMRIARLPAHVRPRSALQFAALSREACDVGGRTVYGSHLVTLVVTPDGWITGVSNREVEGFVDLSAVRFCVSRGISLMDQVSLHTVDVGGSRMVTLQGTLEEKFFLADGGKPLALLPESCRPPQEMHFVVAGTSAGGFHLLSVEPSHGFGVGGDLLWQDSTWNHDQMHLTGIMYEVAQDAMRCATLDSTWTGESLQVFVKDFQNFLTRKFGTIEVAWEKAFDLDGNGSINFTEFGLGCKASGYVGNATRLWAALDEDRSGEISLDELNTGMADTRRRSSAGGGRVATLKLPGIVP